VKKDKKQPGIACSLEASNYSTAHFEQGKCAKDIPASLLYSIGVAPACPPVDVISNSYLVIAGMLVTTPISIPERLQ
jgi:hypothetical protein